MLEGRIKKLRGIFAVMSDHGKGITAMNLRLLMILLCVHLGVLLM
jgi:hypothetical protein